MTLKRSHIFKVGDKVEIIGNIPFHLKDAPRPLLGTVVHVDGGYIDVRPKNRRWIAEFYPREIHHVRNGERVIFCPDCSIEVRLKSESNTEWYGNLKYYKCSSCNEIFVSQNNGELAIAAL